MAKKKARKKKVPLNTEKERKKGQRNKGGFGVFIKSTTDKSPVSGETLVPDAMVLEEIVSGLKDTQDALKWIKEHAGDHEGRTLIIAQIKTQLTCAIEKVVKVRITEE